MAKTENGFILALDQGTTSSRSIIFDNQLTPIAIAQKPLGIITPKAGFIEQNANHFLGGTNLGLPDVIGILLDKPGFWGDDTPRLLGDGDGC